MRRKDSKQSSGNYTSSLMQENREILIRTGEKENEPIYDRNRKWNDNNKAKHQMIQNENQIEEFNNCTFKPNIPTKKLPLGVSILPQKG